MKTQAIITKIYPPLNQLEMFTHPETGLIYRMLSDSKLIQLAEQSIEVLLRMGIDQIIISESGAVPFAKICAWLSRKKNLSFQWYTIKIPRNLKETFQITLQAYRSISVDALVMPHELNSQPTGFTFHSKFDSSVLPDDYFDLQGRNLKAILDSIQENITFPELPNFLSKTEQSGLAKILNKPFVFFDEYIDSGKTLFQTVRFLKLFRQSLKFKVFSYLIKLPKADLDPSICESLHTLDDAFQAYKWGVYPFENRIDWLGYYYVINPYEFKKVCVSELSLPLKILNPILIDSCFDFFLRQETLLNDVKQACGISQVKEFVTNEHLIQYCLFQLEKIYFGESMVSELLYQLFDLYGPIWSPLPDSYHLSYLDAFEKVNPKIIKFLTCEFIKNAFQNVRNFIISEIATLIEERRVQQQQSLLMTMEKSYES